MTTPPAGHKLQVLHQSDSAYVALSAQRVLGLVALHLRSGVLLATFGRGTQPPVALTAVSRAAAAGFAGSSSSSSSILAHSSSILAHSSGNGSGSISSTAVA
jgi:hypothetical protein